MAISTTALAADTIVWQQEFESGWGDWYLSDGIAALGTPTGGPGAAHSLPNCLAVRLDGKCPQYVVSTVVSHTFVVPAASENPRLRFWWWKSAWGYARVYARLVGGSWSELWDRSTSTFGQWMQPSINLAGYAGKNIQIMLDFYGDYGTGTGWFVDDVALVTGTPQFRNPEDFEAGLGDWYVADGIAAVGKPTGGPGAAHSPTQCLAVGLDGNCPEYVVSSVVSPPFKVAAAAENPRLRFWWWKSDWGSGSVYAREVGGSWSELWDRNTSTYGDWVPSEPISLLNFAGKTIEIALDFEGDYGTGPGWFVDDLEILPIPVTNHSPEIGALPDRVVGEETELAFDVTATDSDLPAQTLTFGLAASAPAGASLVGTGTSPLTGKFKWTPTEAQGPSDYPIIVRVGDGTTTTEKSFTVTVREVNRAPELTVPGPLEVYVGQSLEVNVTATDPDLPTKNTLTLSLAGAPSGMTIAPTGGVGPLTGEISWTPSTEGAYTVTVRVTDNGTPVLSDEKSLGVTVIRPPTPPTITCVADQELPPNGATDWLPFTVSDQETLAGQLIVTAESSNPVLVPTSRIYFYGQGEQRYLLLVPTPGESGRASITLCVTDSGGLKTCCAPFELVVCPGGPDIVQQPADQVAELGDRVTFTVKANSLGSLTYQWKHEGVDIPGANNDTLILPSVTAADAGSHTVMVSDGVCSATSAPAQLRLVPELECEVYAVITVHGIPGHKYLLQYSESVEEPRQWNDLGWIVLERTPQLFIDMTSTARIKRFYRAVRQL